MNFMFKLELEPIISQGKCLFRTMSIDVYKTVCNQGSRPLLAITENAGLRIESKFKALPRWLHFSNPDVLCCLRS